MSYLTDYAYIVRKGDFESQKKRYAEDKAAALFTAADCCEVECGTFSYIVGKGEFWQTSTESREELKLKEILAETGGRLILINDELDTVTDLILGTDKLSDEDKESITELAYIKRTLVIAT